jgi:hypothetical protein
MDIISYGIANKAGSSEKETRNETLAPGVQGRYKSVKERIESLERALEGLTLKANKLIVNDTVNIMKANAKLNAVAGSMRYQMENMIFDDLLDLSGIDIENSQGYTHDVSEGSLIAGLNSTIITKEEIVDSSPEKVILSVEEGITEDEIIASNEVDKEKPFSGDRIAPYWNTGIYGPGNNYNSYIGIKHASTVRLSEIKIKLMGNVNVAVLQKKVQGSFVDVKEINVAHQSLTIELNEVIDEWRILITETEGQARPYVYGISYKAKPFPGEYSISRNDGETWESITPEELFYFDSNISPAGKSLKIKAGLPSGAKLLNYALTWA